MNGIFLSGCSYINAAPEIIHQIEFIKDTDIEFKEDIHSSEFIVAVDGIKVNRNNIEDDKLYISNFSVLCPEIEMRLGVQNIEYKIGNEKFNLEINITDHEPPVIEMKKNLFRIKENTELELHEGTDYTVKDNFSIPENIEVNLKKNKTDEYILSATDECGNRTDKTVKVVIEEKKEVISNKADKNNDDSNSHLENKNDSSDKSEEKSSAAAYNRFFEGRSIENYDEACQYAEKILNSKKAKGYEVIPTGKGYQVNFK